ncbi:MULTISPECIES: ABC transporter substrate-binding protein [unclassified Microbacterium]|uniref:ABC transporter substrate-binding protein n=1 Tax=unclassified Microbacterium TaxID=2609290 RepID=UPI0012F7D4B5|nr:ABC transporter substrate-binding protein [Microbacterium sp. MAH-37]MVQ41294.1 glycine/betaine ABC transporter [Microbacterium sp. MAH-37]
MFAGRTTRTIAVTGIAALAAVALAGCGGNPLDEPSKEPAAGGDKTIVIGSQAYYSNEIIAEVYAQALEDAGFTVDRKFNIGQRDAYMPEVESGAIDLFPEYTGNLLEYFDKDTKATGPDEVYEALEDALPDQLDALDYAQATDQDTYTVTQATADKYGLKSIADLSKADKKLTIGAAPEFEQRPYGPAAAKTVYGVDLAFSATGPTTLESLLAGTIDVADIYSADPAFQTEKLVALEDPDNMILSSNVVPIVAEDFPDKAEDVIDAVSAKLTVDALVGMNVRSTVDKKEPTAIAKAWLADQGLVG